MELLVKFSVELRRIFRKGCARARACEWKGGRDEKPNAHARRRPADSYPGRQFQPHDHCWQFLHLEEENRI